MLLGSPFHLCHYYLFLFHWFISYVGWCPLQTGPQPELCLVAIPGFRRGLLNSNMIRKNHRWWFCAPVQCYRYTDPPGDLVKGLVPQSLHFVPLIPPKCRKYQQKCQDVLYLAPWLHKSSQMNKKNTDKIMSTAADGLPEDKMFWGFFLLFFLPANNEMINIHSISTVQTSNALLRCQKPFKWI